RAGAQADAGDPPPAHAASGLTRRLAEPELTAHRAGALVPRLDAQRGAGRRLDHPLELREVGRRRVVAPPRRRAELDAALELADLRLDLAGRKPHAVRQLQLDLDRPHRLPLLRLLRHVGREPAGVLQDETDAVHLRAELLRLERA